MLILWLVLDYLDIHVDIHVISMKVEDSDLFVQSVLYRRSDRADGIVALSNGIVGNVVKVDQYSM